MRIFLKAITIMFGFVAPLAAHASYVITIERVGSDVVATGSGSLDTTDLALYVHGDQDPAALVADQGLIIVGPAAYTSDDYYTGFSGPGTFGSGDTGDEYAQSGGGNLVGIVSVANVLVVPENYVSGGALGTSTATWDNTTLAGLGVTDGTYVFSWGSGVDADSLTVYAGPTSTPEPASLALLLSGLFGIRLIRRRT
jgi:hypothetical protein